MGSFTCKQRILAALVAGFAVAAAIGPAVAQQTATPPDFSANLAGWVGLNGGGPFYEPVPGRLPPVVSDPAHPFTPNGVGKQPTFRIADLSNPNLKPWVKEHMKKDLDEVLAGRKSAFTPQSSCVPAGVRFSWAMADRTRSYSCKLRRRFGSSGGRIIRSGGFTSKYPIRQT